jgi:hypothetical protein
MSGNPAWNCSRLKETLKVRTTPSPLDSESFKGRICLGILSPKLFPKSHLELSVAAEWTGY